jgi:hypothetical protein
MRVSSFGHGSSLRAITNSTWREKCKKQLTVPTSKMEDTGNESKRIYIIWVLQLLISRCASFAARCSATCLGCSIPEVIHFTPLFHNYWCMMPETPQLSAIPMSTKSLPSMRSGWYLKGTVINLLTSPRIYRCWSLSELSICLQLSKREPDLGPYNMDCSGVRLGPASSVDFRFPELVYQPWLSDHHSEFDCNLNHGHLAFWGRKVPVAKWHHKSPLVPPCRRLLGWRTPRLFFRLLVFHLDFARHHRGFKMVVVVGSF